MLQITFINHDALPAPMACNRRDFMKIASSALAASALGFFPDIARSETKQNMWDVIQAHYGLSPDVDRGLERTTFMIESVLTRIDLDKRVILLTLNNENRDCHL